MDSLRGSGSDFGHDAFDFDRHSLDDDDIAVQSPPEAVGQDERRMQVRAYNFWASLLGSGHYPPVESLLAGRMPGFADHSVLLHFDSGIEDPAIAYLGSALHSECDAQAGLKRLSDVPGRSLLSRITDHYMQIIANRAPIGFEAEFVNHRGRTILYRGILLPFSTDDETIDYIYGVINWKEVADQAMTDALMLEIGQVLDETPVSRRGSLPAFKAVDAWADGPSTLDLAEFGAEILPFPSPLSATSDLAPPQAGDTARLADETAMSLADWLASARDFAAIARSSEDRTRGALYAAISRAWDFAIAADEAPEDYAELVADAGIAMQERAPLTPLVKLVFGADYDKTRLTEFATALGHARRIGLGRGELADFLALAPGGLKGVVANERRLRRADSGKDTAAPGAALAEGLRKLPKRTLSSLPADGNEFALVLLRRLPDGEVALLGEIVDDLPLFERAARRLIG